MTDNTAPGEPWDVAQGIRELRRDNQLSHVPACISRLESALAPVHGGWLADRLGVMWNAMGHSRDPDVATAWLHETGRLLADLPTDIVADAIDEAIKASERGFMPSIGEIRKIADPMVAKRKRALARLNAVVNHQAEKPAEIERPTSEQITDILRAFGHADVADRIAHPQGLPKVERGPRRSPTADDYRALGVDEAVVADLEAKWAKRAAE